MKTEVINSNILSFTEENESEKVFCFVSTKFGESGGFVMIVNEKEIKDEKNGIDVDFNELDKLAVGETLSFGYWYYQKAYAITRLA